MNCRNDNCERDRWQPRVQGALAAYCEECTRHLMREGSLPVLTPRETIEVEEGLVLSDSEWTAMLAALRVVALSGRKEGAPVCA